MFLRKKIAASSLVEVVIAIAVIALCFGVASLVFIRSVKVSANFQDVKHQTEIQSKLWESMHTHTSLEEWDDLTVEISEDENNPDSLRVMSFIGNDGKIIWKQQQINDK